MNAKKDRRWPVTRQRMVGGVAAIAAAMLLAPGAGAETAPPFKDKLTAEALKKALRGGGLSSFVAALRCLDRGVCAAEGDESAALGTANG